MMKATTEYQNRGSDDELASGKNKQPHCLLIPEEKRKLKAQHQDDLLIDERILNELKRVGDDTPKMRAYLKSRGVNVQKGFQEFHAIVQVLDNSSAENSSPLATHSEENNFRKQDSRNLEPLANQQWDKRLLNDVGRLLIESEQPLTKQAKVKS